MAEDVKDRARIGNPVKAAIRMSRKLSAKDVADATKKKDAATRALKVVSDLEGELFGVESAVRDLTSKKRATLSAEARAFEALEKGSKYSVFSLEPLTWRDKRGYPRLAVFSLNSPKFSIASKHEERFDGERVRHRSKATFSPALPPAMHRCYDDVVQTLKGMKDTRGRIQNVVLSTAFRGLIPAEARQAIRQAQGEFKEVFLIAEAMQWELRKKPVPQPRRANPDPLVVGYDGENFWLVTSFDLTPLEKFVEGNFSAR